MKNVWLALVLATVVALATASDAGGIMNVRPQIKRPSGAITLRWGARTQLQTSVSSKTSSVWFTVGGVPGHSAAQGQMVTWAADCQTVDTLQWEIWIDANGNGAFDTTGADELLIAYYVANGDTTGSDGLPDTTAAVDNQIVNMLKCGFPPALYWFRAVSFQDGSSAFDSIRVTPMSSPWATVSGHIHVPGDSALQAGLWVEADLVSEGQEPIFWAAISDSYGNYTINFDAAYPDSSWMIGGLGDLIGASGVYVAPPDTQLFVTTGPHPGVNFNYQLATDSITGDVVLYPGQSLPVEVDVWAQNQNTGRGKSTETVEGHYQIFFTEADSGLWDIGLWWDDHITGYMRPNSRNDLQPVGAGHLLENFTVYPADVVVQGTVTENGGPPANQYRIIAWSQDYQMYNYVISQAGSGSYSLPVSDLESQYSISVVDWDDEHPIPPGWIVYPPRYYPVNPPASDIDFDLFPPSEFIEGQITQDPGDAQIINFDQTYVNAQSTSSGGQFYNQPDGAGNYLIPLTAGSYNVWAWSDGFLFLPGQHSNVTVNANDTIRGVDFIANYAHCQVEANLVGYPAGFEAWMNAMDAAGWPNGYVANAQVNGPGTWNLYICNSTGWTLYPPEVSGYTVAPNSYSIGDITHADTYRGIYTFTYTSSGVAGKPETALPKTFALFRNRPNPVSTHTEISFQLPSQRDVCLTIYNMLGQEVKSWRQEAVGPGYHTVNWDGRDMRGDKVCNGVYFYRLIAGDFTATRRMSVVR